MSLSVQRCEYLFCLPSYVFSKGLLSPGGCLEPLTVNTPCFEPEVMDVKVEVDVINVVSTVLFPLLTVKAIKPDDI